MAKRVIIYGDELYHHGILGMKWGKKNGPPYPLDPEDHSASEKKAGWKKSLNNLRAKRHESAAKNISKDASDLRAHGYKNEADAVQKVADKHKAKAESIRKGERKGLTDKQKKALLAIGATAAVAGLAAYGTYKISGHNASKLANEYLSLWEEGKDRVDKYFKSKGTNISAGPYIDLGSEMTKFTNGSYESHISNLNANKQKQIQEKLSKNIYNRLTGDYDKIVTSHVDTGAKYKSTVGDDGYIRDTWWVEQSGPSVKTTSRTKTYRNRMRKYK